MKELTFYLITIILWVAMAFIIYFHSLPVPQGLGGIGVGVIYLAYLFIIVVGTILLFILSSSTKKFLFSTTIPFLFTGINILIMISNTN